MITKLICWLWGHKTTAFIHEMPVVITDFRLFKGENVPRRLVSNTLEDINLSMLPPNMRLGDAFFIGPSIPCWQRLAFCSRCGQPQNERAPDRVTVTTES